MADKKKKGFIKRIALFGGAGLFGLLALTFVGLYIGSSSALGETYEVETYAIEIPEGDDEAIARGKYGFNKNILDVTMRDGVAHRITIERYDDFTTRLRAELARHASLIEDGEQRWKVSA